MEPRPNNPKDELIAKLVKKDIHLSYSSIKNFTSPINFLDYKLKPKTSNPSMVFGSLCDCLILTPDNFDKEFSVIESIPTSDNQVSFSNALIQISIDRGLKEISEDIIISEFPNHYKKGEAIATYQVIKEYVEGTISGKRLITQDIFDEAKKVSDNLMSQTVIQNVFSQITDVQKKIEWNYDGWSNIGYLDILLNNHIIDLKFSRDANPEKFERDIQNFDYFLQAGMYYHGSMEMGITDCPNYSFIVYDKSMNFSIIELDYSYVMYGFRKYKYLVQELNRCISEGRFDESYGFFKNSYRVSKPKWAKAYLLEGEED